MRDSPAELILHLARHAKSSWDDSSLSDFERPLNDRGRRDAPRMARRLSERGAVPDIIVSSPAVRALSTARAFAEVWDIEVGDIVEDPDLYGADPEEILAAVRGIEGGTGPVMVVAHDPGMTELAGSFPGEQVDHMPTCAIVTVRFSAGDWGRVGLHNGVVEHFDYPKRRDG